MNLDFVVQVSLYWADLDHTIIQQFHETASYGIEDGLQQGYPREQARQRDCGQ